MRRKVRLEDARRLAVARQRLSGPRPKPVTADDIHALVRAIGCLQLDPTALVARNHLLVLFSRLGAFDPKLVDTLLWDQRRLYEYWAHQASIVPTDDRALHTALPPPWLDQRTTAAWMTTRARFSELVLERLAANGSVRAAEFDHRHPGAAVATGSHRAGRGLGQRAAVGAGGHMVPKTNRSDSGAHRCLAAGRRPLTTSAWCRDAEAGQDPFRPAPLPGTVERLEGPRSRGTDRSS